MGKTLDTKAVTNELEVSDYFTIKGAHAPGLQEPSPTSQVKEVKVKTKKQDIQQTSNMTILQLTDKEIEELREPSYMAQTFRLTNNEIEWAKDTAYLLSKKIKRGKVTQVDILRISFKLFEKFRSMDQEGLIKILDRIK